LSRSVASDAAGEHEVLPAVGDGIPHEPACSFAGAGLSSRSTSALDAPAPCRRDECAGPPLRVRVRLSPSRGRF